MRRIIMVLVLTLAATGLGAIAGCESDDEIIIEQADDGLTDLQRVEQRLGAPDAVGQQIGNEHRLVLPRDYRSWPRNQVVVYYYLDSNHAFAFFNDELVGQGPMTPRRRAGIEALIDARQDQRAAADLGDASTEAPRPPADTDMGNAPSDAKTADAPEHDGTDAEAGSEMGPPPGETAPTDATTQPATDGGTDAAEPAESQPAG